jgi:hypothetical protein
MKELTPHPQADILIAIARGKTVQMRNALRESKIWHDEPTPFEYLSDDRFEWRIKPETITINGHEVPAPVRESSPDVEYWCVDLNSKMRAHRNDFYGDETQERCLKLGLVHLTQEAAIAHAEALLSFTRSDK